MSILLQGGTVLTMAPDRTPRLARKDILVVENAVSRIDDEILPTADAKVIDARDRLITPGLVNGHLHSFAALQRGRYDNLPLELWMLYAYPGKGAAPLSEDLIYLRTLVVGMESLRAGVTCVLDDVLEIPSQDLHALRTVFRAYRDLGLRACCSGYVLDRHLVDTLPFVDDVLPRAVLNDLRANRVSAVDDYVALSHDALAEFHGAADGLLRYVLSPSGPQRCSPELLATAHDLAVSNDAIFHLHVLETKGQLLSSQQQYGQSLIEYMHELGVLTDHTTMAHCIWLTARDIELVGDCSASVVHNPTSNLRTGAGIAPWRALHDAGVNVALGTDGIASNGSARMFDVMRAAALLHKISSHDYATWPTASEVFYAATRGGAVATRLGSELGAIEIGMAADLVLFRLDSYNFTPTNDLCTHLVYSENGASVDTVLVGGRIVLDRGMITEVDEDSALRTFREMMPEFARMWERAEKANAPYARYFAEVYRRGAVEDIGMERLARTQEAAGGRVPPREVEKYSKGDLSSESVGDYHGRRDAPWG